MTDLQTLFAIQPGGDFMHRCAAVYHSAQRDFIAGIADEPDHWLFNMEGVMQLRCSIAAVSHFVQNGHVEDRPLFGLPIIIDLQDRSDTARFEVITKPAAK